MTTETIGTALLPASGMECINTAGKSQTHEVASFDCCEVVLGELLGTGAFCDVHDLYDVQLLSHIEADELKCPIHEESKQRKREHIHRTCRDATGRSRYVMKHLRPNLTADRGVKIFNHAAMDVLKEFDILSRLSHPNIAKLWGSSVLERHSSDDETKDYGKIVCESNPEKFFLVLERIEQTLSQRILRWILTEQRSPRKCENSDSNQFSSLPPFYAEKLLYAQDIASALDHIHSSGMVFRDLKPDNVGIASNGTAKLFDFGLCREMPRGQASTTDFRDNLKREPVYRMSKVGTRRYMSPEMITGHGYNQKTDTYSWAMVLYEMLCLEKPYAKYNRKMHKILVCDEQGRPRASADIPWAARDLLKRSWCHDFSHRLTMKEVYDELGRMINIVEQQTLPLIERSLRAVLEMAKLFGFGNDDGGATTCTTEDTRKIIPSPCPSKTKSRTELSVLTATNRNIVAVE